MTSLLPSVPRQDLVGEVYIRCDACGVSTARRELQTIAVELGRSRGGGIEIAMVYIHIFPSMCRRA